MDGWMDGLSSSLELTSYPPRQFVVRFAIYSIAKKNTIIHSM